MKRRWRRDGKNIATVKVKIVYESNINEIKNELDKIEKRINCLIEKQLKLGIQENKIEENMKTLLEDVERITVETEDGKEIATIINDNSIDTPITVADGYVIRLKPYYD